jgi:hypothetical protein
VAIGEVAMPWWARIAVVASSLFCAPVAYAGPYIDDLSKCLVKSTGPDDQIVFMHWMFSAFSLQPAVSGLTTITAEQRAGFDKKAANLFVRLMRADCRQQTIDAVRNEGSAAMQSKLFGQAAMRGLVTNAQGAGDVHSLGYLFPALRTLDFTHARGGNFTGIVEQVAASEEIF